MRFGDQTRRSEGKLYTSPKLDAHTTHYLYPQANHAASCSIDAGVRGPIPRGGVGGFASGMYW